MLSVVEVVGRGSSFIGSFLLLTDEGWILFSCSKDCPAVDLGVSLRRLRFGVDSCSVCAGSKIC